MKTQADSFHQELARILYEQKQHAPTHPAVSSDADPRPSNLQHVQGLASLWRSARSG